MVAEHRVDRAGRRRVTPPRASRPRSGSPCVVRSPASRTRSAFPSSAANAASSRPRCGSAAWMSPAAAMRTGQSSFAAFPPRHGGRTIRRAPRRVCGARARGRGARFRSDRRSCEDCRCRRYCDAEIPFALGGGLACWARGGPKTEHDVDFFVTRENAGGRWRRSPRPGYATERPPEQLAAEGVGRRRPRRPDLRPVRWAGDDEWIERAEQARVPRPSPPASPRLEDVLVTKLLGALRAGSRLRERARDRPRRARADRLGRGS